MPTPLNPQFLHDDFAFIGPPLEEGPLPAVFYFSLSASDSLSLDPFNQPVVYWSQFPMRIFSLTLPGHENFLPPQHALSQWKMQFEQGYNPIQIYIDQIKQWTERLLKQGVLIEDRLAVAGLSRGAFMATHVAAQIPAFKTILGYAPLTKLGLAKEFTLLQHHPLITNLDLDLLVSQLTHTALRFYIGNLDVRVSTRSCFDFIESLSQASFEKQIRSPQVELIISPSIGKDGHGTSEMLFHQGAQWIATQLGIPS